MATSASSPASPYSPCSARRCGRVNPAFPVRAGPGAACPARAGRGVAFAPGDDVPDAFVEDVKRLTYTAYDDSPGGNDDFLDEESLDQRMKDVGKPLMVLMGAEEQIVNDPRRALDQYKRSVPDAQTH